MPFPARPLSGEPAIRTPAPGRPTLVEIFGQDRDAGAAGFSLAQVPRGGAVLWVQDRLAARETGHPHGRAFQHFGADPDRLVLACGRDGADVLWTMEEGLKCTALAAVIGEIWGNPRALDFTATKRLALRAERAGVHAFLIRFGAAAGLSSARRRWRVASCPSAAHPHDPRAPGAPCWRVELFRARGQQPGTWVASYDAAAHRLDLSAAFRDPVPAPAAQDRRRAG